jgi:diguanylate cyclase (GGDEF)-like protein
VDHLPSAAVRPWRAVRHLLGSYLPHGRQLPQRDWAARHRVIMAVLIAHAVGVAAYGISQADPVGALNSMPIAVAAALAGPGWLPRRLRTAVATLGVMTTSAVLVHLSGGLIEMHFHFFVMLAVVTFYQDWLAFLLAFAFVVSEHAVLGVVAPHLVYSHQSAWHHPVRWAAIHGLFVAGAGVAGLANWRLTERAQAAQRATAERLAHEASHDPLTGALNRREFDRRLAAALSAPGQTARRATPAHAARRGGPAHAAGRSASYATGERGALCFLDLDRFKIVNDSCGHAGGDLLLRQITDLARGLLRAGDDLARIGGDEFAVLLHGVDRNGAAEFAERARRAIADFRFRFGGQVFTVGVSIGVVVLDSGHAHDLGASALRAADAACYTAKDRGRNRVHISAPDDTEIDRHQGQVRWAERVMSAAQTDAFTLFYQPIVPIAPDTDHTVGELLIRLRLDDGTLVAPGAFMPAAERYNLLGTIDRWVVGAAFAALGRRYAFDRPAEPAEMFSINLSGASIGDDTFLHFVRESLTRHRVPPAVVCFEVTETVAITDLDTAVRFITELRALGCRFALDDFGTGLSSFTYLKRLPVDLVKIDGNFVRDLVTDPVDRAMVESVNRIAHEMGLRTVAEFVESDETLRCLRRIGIDYVQGFATGYPEPFDGWLDRNPVAVPVPAALAG